MPPRPPSTRTRWDPSTAPPSVWLVGPWDAAEFAVVRPAITSASATEFATPDDAHTALAEGAAPSEVMLLAQPRPGCWPPSAVDALQAAAPLARIVIVAGTWCEGEPRTGQPLVGAVRLYWHELPAWWREAMARRDAGLAPHWSRREPYHPEIRRGVRTQATLDNRLIAIDVPDFAVFETLAAALRPYGAACVWTPRHSNPPPSKGGARGGISTAANSPFAAGVFDGSQLDPAEVAELRRFCERFDRRPAPVIAMVDFPRTEHFTTLHEVGASVLLGKPYSIVALVNELVRIAIGYESIDFPAPSPWRGGLGRGEAAGTRIANRSRVPSASPLPNPPRRGEGTGTS